jgi:hypothetical protein
LYECRSAVGRYCRTLVRLSGPVRLTAGVAGREVAGVRLVGERVAGRSPVRACARRVWVVVRRDILVDWGGDLCGGSGWFDG